MSREASPAFDDNRYGGVSDLGFPVIGKRIDNSCLGTQISGRCLMRFVLGADTKSAAVVARFPFPSRHAASAGRERWPGWSIFASE